MVRLLSTPMGIHIQTSPSIPFPPVKKKKESQQIHADNISHSCGLPLYFVWTFLKRDFPIKVTPISQFAARFKINSFTNPGAGCFWGREIRINVKPEMFVCYVIFILLRKFCHIKRSQLFTLWASWFLVPKLVTRKRTLVYWSSFGKKQDKSGEIRDTKTLNLSRNIVSFQVFGRCFSFFTLRDQLVAQQKHLLRVEESCCSK